MCFVVELNIKVKKGHTEVHYIGHQQLLLVFFGISTYAEKNFFPIFVCILFK